MATEPMSFDEATLLFKRCLRVIGVLPCDFVGRKLLFVFFITSSIIHWSMFVFNSIGIKGTLPVEIIYETVATVGLDIRYYILLAKRREFARLMDACDELWDYCDANNQPLVVRFERKMRKLFWLIFGSIIAVDVLYSATAIFLTYVSDQANGTKTLPFSWYGVEKIDETWPGYKVAFAVQVLVIYNAGLVSATVDSALPLLIILCCGYLRVLRQRLTDITDKMQYGPELVDRELVDCCKFHQKILKLCSRVDKCGRLLFLVELATSGYILSLVAIKLSSSDPQKFKYTPIVALLLGHLLICQYAPDLLMDEARAVSLSVYSSSCVFMNRPSGRYVTIMIIRAQQPLLMTAGGIVVLSIENFGKMLTSAVSFFTTMRNFHD